MAVACDVCCNEAVSVFKSAVGTSSACALHDTDVAETIRRDPRGLPWTWTRQVTYTVWNNEVVFERKVFQKC